MAENVHFKYPNFCFGPIAGTFCSINQDSATTILRIKTSAGSLIADYSLSSNIINELLHVEYVGPSDITEIMDSVTFLVFIIMMLQLLQWSIMKEVFLYIIRAA